MAGGGGGSFKKNKSQSKRGSAAQRLKEEIESAASRDPESSDPMVVALRHGSWCREKRELDNRYYESNERLEFLGDSIVNLAVASYLFKRYPNLSEGELAKVRASVVGRESLAQAARLLNLHQALFMGRTERERGDLTEAVLEDAFEAAIGAYYLKHGLKAAASAVVAILKDRIVQAAKAPGEEDHKTRLQEQTVMLFGEHPVYVVEMSGPSHRPQFQATVMVGKKVLGTGSGTSRRAAEQSAAREARKGLQALAGLKDKKGAGRA